jgi:hypothetical protein
MKRRGDVVNAARRFGVLCLVMRSHRAATRRTKVKTDLHMPTKRQQIKHQTTLVPLLIEHFSSSYHIAALRHVGDDTPYSDCFLFKNTRFLFQTSHSAFQPSERCSPFILRS